MVLKSTLAFIKYFSFVISFILFINNNSFSQSPLFVNAIGSTGSETSNSIYVDNAGNSYITGSFTGTVDFNPGAGTANLTSVGGDDIFFAKYDASGNYVFAKSIGSASDDMGNKIVVDGSGNLYVTGYYWGTADFNPGAAVASLTPVAYNDVFFAKYDANGNYVYAKSVGSNGNDIGYGIVVDGSGNCYITGFFQGTADFNPGAGVANLSPLNGNAGIYFAKYDANGNYVYAKSIGTSIAGMGHDIAIDLSGNCYITGTFWGTADFDPGAGTVTLTAATGWYLYLAKYDASGNYVFAKSLGTVSGNNNYSMVADGSGNCYLTGSFTGSSDFDPGSGTALLTSVGGDDIYFAKYDASGNCVYAKSIGTINDDSGNNISIDNSGNCYITGWYNGTADFNPNPSLTDNLVSAGSSDIFLAKYDASGNYVCAKSFGSTGWDSGLGIASDNLGNCYVTGNFDGVVDFNPDAGITNLTAAGNGDIFLLKIQACTTAPVAVELLDLKGIVQSTANHLFWQTATETNTAFFAVEKSINGNSDWHPVQTIAAAGNSVTLRTYDYLDKNISEPLSFYRIKEVDQNGAFTFSNQVKLIRSNKSLNASVIVYPNPVKDLLYIQHSSPTNNYTIEVYNATGALMYKGYNTLSIYVSSFSRGIYSVKLSEQGNCSFTKFVKQ